MKDDASICKINVVVKLFYRSFKIFWKLIQHSTLISEVTHMVEELMHYQQWFTHKIDSIKESKVSIILETAVNTVAPIIVPTDVRHVKKWSFVIIKK